jgi:hypothetical protein
MRTLLPLLTVLLLAAPAHALGGKVRVLGEAVALEGRAGGSKLLLAVDAEGRKVLASLRQFAGLQAFVDGRDTASGFVVTTLTSPFRNETSVLVTARPGHVDQLVVRMGSGAGMAVVGPKAALLAPFVNHEVRLRGWFFLDTDGALPNAVAPVAVRHTPDVGDSAWIVGLDGAQAQGRNAEGEPVTLPVADLRVGPLRGRPGRVRGTLSARDEWTITDEHGHVFVVGGGEGVLPQDFDFFDGRGVEVEGTIVEGDDPKILIERVISPVAVQLTGRVVRGYLHAEGHERALFSREDYALTQLLATAEGKEVTVRGLASPNVLLVQSVAGRVTGKAVLDEGFRLPADGQVWIAKNGQDWSVIVADGTPGFSLVAPGDVTITSGPSKGLAGALAE